MLPGEDKISSNTTIPEYYRTQKLRFNVPRTYLCLRRSKNVLHFRLKCSKFLRFLGLCPRPRWESYDAPPDPLVVRGFLPSAIAVLRLRRLIPISPPNKNTRPISPPNTKS